MSLQVWLPLNGDLHNQGLSNVTVTNDGATIDDNSGKIGKCYAFNNNRISIQGSIFTDVFKSTTQPFSFACWIYLNSDETDRVIIFGNYNANPFINWELSADCKVRLCAGGSSNYTTKGEDTVIPKTTWTHLAVTYDGSNTSFYINGIKKATVTGANTVTTTTSSNTFYLGSDARTGATRLKGKMNDFRFYNHALSPKEVEEIAKGLVLHYKLDGADRFNLIKNGFGELGISENWSNSSGTTTDLPTADSNIKVKFSGPTSVEYIPIYNDHTYKLSLYLKASASSGNTYPSLLTYDIDKNHITYQQSDGMNTATMTTLSQTLNPGDTVIHATNLSTWNVNSGNYYDYVAIFGWRDSAGYIYPDGEYTRNIQQYNSGTEAKSNINKTNNTITLLNAYSGPVVPAGTSICQSTAGSGYDYPLGSIAVSSITDWTYKETTFTFANSKRRRNAKYVRFLCSSKAYYAGIKLIDLTDGRGTTVYDSSGYSNNGTINGTLTAAAGSPRYNVATYISSGNTDYITTPTIYLPGDQITMNFWFKSTNTTPGSNYHMPLEGTASNNQSYEMSIHNTGYLRGGLVIGGTRYAYNCTSTKLLNGNWHMCTMTYDGTTIKRYVDAVMEKDTSVTGALVTSTQFVLGHYGSATSYHCKEAYMSDVRIYTTALTDEQVKELYNTSMSIDSNGNIHARELVETI